MNRIIFLSLFVAFCGYFVLGQEQQKEVKRVNVAVYYESLCPASQRFFTKQLYPSLQGNLSKHVNLTLIPYGKAETIHDPQTHEISFKCQHGEPECHGNKIQACALKLIDGGRNSDNLGYNKIAVGFINCLMDRTVRKGNDTTFPTQDCSGLNHVEKVAEIENCAIHTEATDLLVKYGDLTNALTPHLQTVPTIVFNNQFKQADYELSQTNFVKALCQYISGEKPAECFKSGAAMTSLNVALMFFVISSLIF